MDSLITSDCPECHGKGSVPVDPAHPLDRYPCGTCLRRWDDANPLPVSARARIVMQYLEQPHLNDPGTRDLVEAELATTRAARLPAAPPEFAELVQLAASVADCDPVVRVGCGEDPMCYFCGGVPAQDANDATLVHRTVCLWLVAQALRARLAARTS